MEDSGGGILYGKVKKIKDFVFGIEYNRSEYDVQYSRQNLPFMYLDVKDFNDRGQITNITRYDVNSELVWKNTLKYNGYDFWVEQYIYSPRDISMRTVCRLNENGIRTGHDLYVSGFGLGEVAHYVYDKKGRIRKVKYYGNESDLTKVETDKYDSLGKNIETVEWMPGKGVITRLSYKYNKAGLKTERIIERYRNESSDIYKSIEKYDSRQNERNTIYYNRNNEIIDEYKAEYIYNEYNNWEEMKRYKNGKLVELVRREIEYFGES